MPRDSKNSAATGSSSAAIAPAVIPVPAGAWATHVLERIPQAFVALDHEWRYRYVNEAAERVLGRSRREMLGRVIWDVFPQTVGTPLQDLFQRAARERCALQEEQCSPVTGGWMQISVHPFDGGVSVFFSDITARKCVEEDLRRRLSASEAEAERLRSRIDELVSQEGSPAGAA